MKKMFCIVAVAVSVVLLVSGCASKSSARRGSSSAAEQPTGRRVPGGVPEFVKQAIRSTPEDALIGIGSAKLASKDQSRTIATTRARAEISRQMNTIIQDMIRDYQASSEIDPSSALSFQENITVALSKSTLTGSRVVDFDYDSSGACWVVVQIDKSSTVQEINQAQAAARLAVPAMASFNAEDRMNAAFAKVYGEEVRVGDRD